MSNDAGRRRPPSRGRGASVNPAGRFERFAVVPEDDGWGSLDEEPRPVPTTVIPEATRTIIARNDSPDVPFDQSVNPYRGCEHGCAYCFARPTHAYLGLSAGLDFETRIFSKPEAPRLLAEELRKHGYRCQVLVLGANTDPYQPVERDLRITRGILEVLAEHQHPVSIVTKSALVLRDVDLLAPMAARGLASVLLSVTTLDGELARRLEPRAAAPARRVATLGALARAGIPVGVLASPMIPALNDAELERILEACAGAGARWAGYVLVRLPHDLRAIFAEWLETHYPTKARRVLSRIRDLHDGKLYDPRFGERMRGQGPYAALLRDRFDIACRRLGIETGRPRLDTTRFRLPARRGDQTRLFP